MKIAIMQPTFLPWLGYFAMMASVDTFVFLDDVKYAKRSWQSRNRIRTLQGECMLNVPVTRQSSQSSIEYVRVSPEYDHEKLLRQIRQNYARAPFHELVLDIVDSAYLDAEGLLANYSIALIDGIAKHCSLHTSSIRSSSIPDAGGNKAFHLLDLCQSLGATQYLSPPGSAVYLKDDNPFEGSDVELSFFQYDHPSYPQGRNEFMSHLAVIDALAWVGPDKLLSLALSGVAGELAIDELPTTAEV